MQACLIIYSPACRSRWPVVGAGGGDWGAGSVELSRAQLLGKVSAAKEQNKLGAGANAVQTVFKK